MELKGAAAIVTGGSSGLGEAAARLLAERGARVVILDVQERKGADVASEIGGAFVSADVTNAQDVTAGIDAANELGPLRVLVNCAGVASAHRTIGRDGSYESAFDLGEFSRVIGVNLIGTFNCIRLAASTMSLTSPVDADGQRGAIVNTSSGAAFEGQIGQAAYAASKAGIVGMTLPIARDLAVAGIRVNTIAPGLIDTPIYGEGEQAEEFKGRLVRNTLYPARLGDPLEFASLVVEVATNNYINGETIRIDGGARLQPK